MGCIGSVAEGTEREMEKKNCCGMGSRGEKNGKWSE